MNKQEFNKIIFLTISWVGACLLFVFIEETVKDFKPISEDFVERVNYSSLRRFIIASVVTFISGSAIATFEVLYFNKLLQRMSFGRGLLIKTSFYLLNIFFFTSLVVILILSHDLDKSLLDRNVSAAYVVYLSGARIWMNLTYWGIVVFISLFILQVNEKFGRGVLVNLLLGRYNKPRKEIRVFMFLDLTSSAAIAEKLGSEKYSSFLKDFFYDLDEIINETKGAIFQFVGDEVVIVWNVKNATESNNCVKLFFLVEKRIEQNKEKYISRYGIHPQFKAGLHYGEVVITEVGGSKQEIAYHGDAINTASRIRSLCHETKSRLLVSADLIGFLVDLDYLVELIGIFNFKGKKDVLGLFRIDWKKD